MNLDDIRGRATISIAEAGELLGVGRDAAYRAAHAGQLPTLRLGRRIVIPVAKLLALLGEDVDDLPADLPVDLPSIPTLHAVAEETR